MADTWIEGIQKTVEYRREALEFLRRAREQFPVSTPAHVATVTTLWLAADDIDVLCYEALERINQGLLGGASEVEITRGASMQPMPETDPMTEPSLPGLSIDGMMPPQERLYYECAWSLSWNEGDHGFGVRLLADSQTGDLRALVQGRSYPENREITIPVEDDSLLEAVAEFYVKEATADETREEMGRLMEEYQERERALQEAAEAELPPVPDGEL